MGKKEKRKEKGWEGKRKFYKVDHDGNIIPHAYKGFNYNTWKYMTDSERADWTEYSEVETAPIPKEVIEFKEKIKLKVVEADVDEIDTSKPVGAKAVIKAKLKERGIKFAYNSKLETLQKKLADATDPE